MNHVPATQTALVFDWGGTLMKVLPDAAGPMAHWPEVEAVEGAAETLHVLAGEYPLVVATNASDSDATLVWQALHRVGISHSLRAVFTSRELAGARKPQTRFFRQLESVLGRPPHQLIMIGDDYSVDMVGAKAAGWRAIWYNPHRAAPPGMLPLHDTELFDLRLLPALLQQPALPGVETSLAWLAERGTPHNILAHVQLVAATAYQIALWISNAGQKVDPVLAHRGGLLHDLGKMDSIRLGHERGANGDHAAHAKAMLLEYGQPALADIADRHMVSSDPHSARRPVTWEERLVHYADKLAEGARLVSIADRLAALKARYPTAGNDLEGGWPFLETLQQEICDTLNCTPDALLHRLQEAMGLK
jgi:putative hydrolase of the HAD superfamily